MERVETEVLDYPSKQVLADPRFTRALDAPDAARISATESGGVFNSGGLTEVPVRW